MEYQKIINLLNNPPNQTPKFRTNKWVEINDNNYGMMEHVTLIAKLNLKSQC